MAFNWQTQTLAFVCYFLYESFFEWFFHRYLFHSPALIKATYRAHHLVHHQKYKYEAHLYEHREGEEKSHISMDWFALPLFLGFHLPIFAAIQWITGIPSLWGGIASVVAYYAVYEYFHYYMHVPSSFWFEKTGIFKYVKEHHRIHHRHMQKNYNVFFPLADLCLGTYISASQVEVWKTQAKNKETANSLVEEKPLSAPKIPTKIKTVLEGE